MLRSLLAGFLALSLAAVLDLELAGTAADRPYDVKYLPQGDLARIAALGHRTFLSDLYWLDLVQYVGEPRANERGWDKLYPLADLVTDLDPRHGYAYHSVGIVLSARGRLGESNRILKKGMTAGPNWWTYPYYIAFNYWFYLADYENGAHYAEIAAKTPGASSHISHLALALRSKSGKPEDAIELLLELRRQAKDDETAQALDYQLKLAMLERDAQALERAAAEYQQRFGRTVSSLDDLVASGLVASLPEDPFGGTYLWDLSEKKVHSSLNPFRFRIRTKAHAAGFHYQPTQKDLEEMP